MGSDAVRGRARALLGARKCEGALLLTFVMFGCSSTPDRPDTKTQTQPSATTPVNTGAGRAASIGSGGSGTLTDLGPNMLVPGLPGGSSSHTGASAGHSAAVSGSAGAGGTSVAGATAPIAGATVASAGAGAAAGAPGSVTTPGVSMTYPPLDAAAIGMPMQVASGFSLAESPLWDPCTQRLMFTDVSAAGGGVINALGADGMVAEIMKGTKSTNGLAWDIDGSLLLAQMDGGLARRSPAGMVTQIDHGSLTLHTPDDVVVRSDGTIYLSDGNFCPAGALLGYDDALPVYTIRPGMPWVNSGTVKGPNGIELSPDEKSLYVNGFGEGAVYKFDVMPDGSIMKPSKPLVTGLTDPDSLCLDAGGNLYVAVSAGIQVLRPDGSKVKLIPISGRTGACTKAGMTNCTFGGADGKTLYITGWAQIWKVDNMPIPGLDWVVGKQRAKCN